MINGKNDSVISMADFEHDVKKCEDLVVGAFVGRRLSFKFVKNSLLRLWRLKGEVHMTLHGDFMFAFVFSNPEDRQAVLERGHVYIANRLFMIHQWYPMVEKMVEELKIVPIWVSLRKIPLFLWNSRGIGIIASYLGIPIMTDRRTAEHSRINFARVCVEIDTYFYFPSEIPVVIDGKVSFHVLVEYSWKPPICSCCKTFGHSDAKRPKKQVEASPRVMQSALQPQQKSEWVVKSHNKDKGRRII